MEHGRIMTNKQATSITTSFRFLEFLAGLGVRDIRSLAKVAMSGECSKYPPTLSHCGRAWGINTPQTGLACCTVIKLQHQHSTWHKRKMGQKHKPPKSTVQR